jgi:hypothetical protein
MIRAISLLVVSIVLSSAQSAWAGDTLRCSADQRVKLVYRAQETRHLLLIIPYKKTVDSVVTGSLVSYDSSGVTIRRSAAKSADRTIAVGAMRKLSIHDGHRHPFWEGIGYGALYGLIIGGIATIAAGEQGIGSIDAAHHERWNTGQPLLGCLAAGVAIGGTIGLVVKVDRWREVKRSDWQQTFGSSESVMGWKTELAIRF